MQIKIGILLPGSNIIPAVGKDFRNALCLGLVDNPAIDYELVVETTRFNSDKGLVIGKLQDLLIKHDVDIVIAPLNPGMLEYVVPLFIEHEVPLIANTLGEDVLANATLNPYLFVNSLNMWQSCWMSGYWGSKKFGKRAASMSGYHEAGYGLSFAFALGVEAQSGTLVQTSVTHENNTLEDIADKLKEITETKPDFIMGFYSDKEAQAFLPTYRQHVDIPLLTTPYGLSKTLLDEIGEEALGVPSLSSWNTESPNSLKFENIYKQKTEKDPHSYALLAYETGLMLSSAIKNNHKSLVAGLCMTEIDGPRGKISFDKATQTIQTKDYLYEVACADDGTYYHKLVKELPTPSLFNEQLTLASENIAKQGWLNPYLIA